MELCKESGEMVLTGKAGRNIIGRWKAVGLVRKEDVWRKAIGKTEDYIGCKLSFVCKDCSVLPAAADILA